MKFSLNPSGECLYLWSVLFLPGSGGVVFVARGLLTHSPQCIYRFLERMVSLQCPRISLVGLLLLPLA